MHKYANFQRAVFNLLFLAGVKRVAWPPPKEGEDEYSEQEAVQAQVNEINYFVV